ncbi:MAG: TRAP transporter small permease [Oscillospiraceae bacterium]|nr:TRAP transporter small permease [Oscillospiraceae bacterium]
MKIVKLIDDNCEKVLCFITFLSMLLCLVWQLVMRWTGGNLSWTEEAARYLFIWTSWLGISLSVKERSHIKVELLTAIFHEGIGKLIFDLISNVGFFIFDLVIIKLEWDQIIRVSFTYNQKSPAMMMPMGIVYAALVVGGIFVAVRLIEDTIKLILEYKASKGLKKEEA